MDPTPDMVPSAKGDLVKTPLAHLFVFVAERKLQGSLLLRGEDGSYSVVYFASGAPAKVRTSYPGTHLGRVLLQLGYIDDDILESTLVEMEQTGTLHGKLLRSMGAIDEAQLVAGLREQMMRRLLKIFEKAGESTAYEFYGDVNLLSDWGGPEVTPIDSFRIVWEGMHMRPNDTSIEPTLARLGSAPVGINARADFRRFEFGPPEGKVIELLRVRPMSLAQVVALDVMPIRQFKVFIYVLLITKGIMVVPAKASPPANPPVSPPARQPSDANGAADPPPSSSRGVPMARVKLKKSAVPASSVGTTSVVEQGSGPSRAAILERAEKVEEEDYFQVLGVSRTDPPDVARSAYFALAKVWHPDRLPSEMADVQDAASKIFARMSEAFQTLSDADKRAQYVDALDRGQTEKDERVKVQQVIEATIDFQKAEVYLRRRDLDKALKSVQKACEGDPEQAHYAALHAWVLAQQPEAQESKNFERPLAMLDEAVKLNNRCEQAFLYRAMLNKQLGKTQLALRDFRTVVEINPRNIDATREVRLASMRGSKDVLPTTPDKTSGKSTTPKEGAAINWTQDSVGDIFGKLFKKK